MKALRVFEAVARLGGVGKAAEELCVSQGAVSQQIRNLEDYLGCELFIRKPHAFSLSDEGEKFFQVVESALVDIAEAANEVTRNKDDTQLMISTWPSFALKVLMPNLGGFYASNPGVTVALDQSTDVVNFRNDGIDAAIRFGSGEFPGLNCILLLEPRIRAVASPGYLEQHGAMASIKKPAMQTIIDHHYPSSELRKQHVHWEDVIEGDLKDLNVKQLTFPDEQQTLHAAIQGLGVALVSTYAVQEELQEGKIVFAAPDSVPHKGSVYLVWPEGLRENVALEKFKNWLIEILSRF